MTSGELLHDSPQRQVGLVDPSTGETFEHIDLLDAAEADRVIDRAQAAFVGWRLITGRPIRAAAAVRR